MATIAKQSLALATVATGPGGHTAVASDHRYYQVTIVIIW